MAMVEGINYVPRDDDLRPDEIPNYTATNPHTFQDIDCFFIIFDNISIFFDENRNVLPITCSWSMNKQFDYNVLTKQKHTVYYNTNILEFMQSQLLSHKIPLSYETIDNAFIGFDYNYKYVVGSHAYEMYLHYVEAFYYSERNTFVCTDVYDYCGVYDLYHPISSLRLQRNVLYKFTKARVTNFKRPHGFPFVPNCNLSSLIFWNTHIINKIPDSPCTIKNVSFVKHAHPLNINNNTYKIDKTCLDMFGFVCLDTMKMSKLNVVQLIRTSENCIVSWGSNHFINIAMNGYNMEKKFLVICDQPYAGEWGFWTLDFFKQKYIEFTFIEQNNMYWMCKYSNNNVMFWDTSKGTLANILQIFCDWIP